jgi:hypothetical protein
MRPDFHRDCAVVVLGHGADRIQQGQHRVPFDVVALRLLEQLAECVAVVVIQVLWLQAR